MSYSIDFNEDLPSAISTNFYYKFTKIIEGFIFFHLFSQIFILILFSLTIILSNINPKSIPHGIAIASSIVSFFSYLTLKQFLDAKKFTQIEELLSSTFDKTFENQPAKNGWDEISFYKNLKYMFQYQVKEKVFLNLNLSILNKIKISFLFKFYSYVLELIGRNILLQAIKMIEDSPIDLKAHTEYANSLLDQIDNLNIPSQLLPYFFEYPLKKLQNEEHKKKIDGLYKLAIEELKILDSLAPKDPWTHAKLAECYRGIHQYDLELSTIELLRSLRPSDKEILFKLGELYFHHQKYADGIKVYALLKHQDNQLAIKMMKTYRISQELSLS